jgi:hypothetical protein
LPKALISEKNTRLVLYRERQKRKLCPINYWLSHSTLAPEIESIKALAETAVMVDLFTALKDTWNISAQIWRSQSLRQKAVTLPAERYYSPEIYRLEQEPKSPENLDPLIQFFDNLQKEDLDLLPAVQTRTQSMGYKQGRLSLTREVETHLFQELIMKAIAASTPSEN